jgi:hypothetical protein
LAPNAMKNPLLSEPWGLDTLPPSTLSKGGLDVIAHKMLNFIAIFGMWQVSNLRPLPPPFPNEGRNSAPKGAPLGRKRYYETAFVKVEAAFVKVETAF